MGLRVFLLVVVLSLFSLCVGTEKQKINTATTFEGVGSEGTTTSLETPISTTSTTLRDCPGAQEAFKAYSDAEKFYSAGDCMNASLSIAKALQSYSDCGSQEEIEKTDLLAGRISLCLSEIAGRTYVEAVLLYGSRNLSDSLQKAKEAKTLFEEAGNESAARQCDLLIHEVTHKLSSAAPGLCGMEDLGTGYNISNCDDSCEKDDDCKYSCVCGALNVDEICNTGGKFNCMNIPVKCLEGICVAEPQG